MKIDAVIRHTSLKFVCRAWQRDRSCVERLVTTQNYGSQKF